MERADGQFALVAIETSIVDEAPFLRKSGMGGPRYLRHCLESAILQRGGLWSPETIADAIDLLIKIDGGIIVEHRFETWVYQAQGDNVAKLRDEDWLAQPSLALQPRRRNENERNWEQTFAQMADAAADESQRASLAAFWVTWPRDMLVQGSAAGAGEATTALLALRASQERQFLIDSHSERQFAVEPYHRFTSARYIRALCQIEHATADASHSALLLPELTDMGRTILLLCAVGRLNEARELGVRMMPFLGAAVDQFLPPLARMALVWATGLPGRFDVGRDRISGTTLESDCAYILDHLDDADSITLSACLMRILDARLRQFMDFDDEAHTDFDEMLVTVLAAEVGAVNWWRRAKGCETLVVSHPLLDLSVADFPDLSARSSDFADIHAKVLTHHRNAQST